MAKWNGIRSFENQQTQGSVIMYAEHNPRIRDYAQREPSNLARTGVFVLASIRVPFWKAAQAMQGDPTAQQHAFALGFKLQGASYLIHNANTLYDAILEGTLPGALRAAQCVPGLGLAKAGFLVQLVRGEAGCLDTHNLRRYGLQPREFVLYGTAAEATIWRCIDRYLDTIEGLGGSEVLWDSWCAYLAGRIPARYTDADHVSALHCDALGV